MTRPSASPCMHEVLFDDTSSTGTGVTTLDFRQGDDRRGLSSDDHVFPAGRAWGDADRADRIRIQGKRSTGSCRHAARSWLIRRQSAAIRNASSKPRATRRAAGWTKHRQQGSRSCAGSQKRQRRRLQNRTATGIPANFPPLKGEGSKRK